MEDIKIKIKPSSHANYHNNIKFHILPYFSNKKPTITLVSKFVKDKFESGLSAKTVHDLYSILKQIVEYSNKSIDLDVPLPKINQGNFHVLDILTQKKLVSYISTSLDTAKLGVLIALYTGIRIGELSALTWQDIDFETGILKVTKTLQRIKNTTDTGKKTRIIIDTPKSKKSIRDIPIPQFLLDILKDYMPNCPDSYVLTGTRKYMEPRTYQGKFKDYLECAGIDDIPFHTTRHTFATRAIELGMDIKTLSEILGHSSVRFTLERYVHSSNETKKKSMDKFILDY